MNRAPIHILAREGLTWELVVLCLRFVSDPNIRQRAASKGWKFQLHQGGIQSNSLRTVSH